MSLSDSQQHMLLAERNLYIPYMPISQEKEKKKKAGSELLSTNF